MGKPTTAGGCMYVCLCTGVTSDQIQEAINNGANSAAEITALTGAGSNCGSCLTTVIAMMLEAQPAKEIEVSHVQTGFPLPILSAA
jgi:bacterioferritin-associated ferredoxin